MLFETCKSYINIAKLVVTIAAASILPFAGVGKDYSKGQRYHITPTTHKAHKFVDVMSTNLL